MRWFVEIAPLGASSKEAEGTTQLCVEAAQWQPALQQARTLLGEEAGLAHLSVELLADGYQAVDPKTQKRYVVRKAPNDAPLSDGVEESASRSNGAAPPKSPGRSVPPPGGRRPMPSSPPAIAWEPVPSYRLVASQEQDPTPRTPLAYREQVFEVAPGTSESAAALLLLERFDEVRDAIAGLPPGKLINLAVFNGSFEAEPPPAPLATLTWKDWKRADPEVRYPARDEAEGIPPSPPSMSYPPAPAAPKVPSDLAPPPAPSSPSAAASSPPASPSVSPAAAASSPPASPSVSPAAAASSPPASPSASPAAATSSPPASPSASPAAATSSPPAAISRPPAPSPARPSSVPPAAARPSGRPPARGASIPPPSTPQSKRISGEDLIVELFESASDLHFLRDALEGADFVLTLALEKLPSEVGLVSLFDIDKREFVVVHQMGGPRAALLTRLPERAPLASAAMRTKLAVVVADAAEATASDPRWAKIGISPRSLLVAPVELGGRYLGLIELANPQDGRAYSPGDGHALTYIGQQYAEFVAARGVVLDAETVLAARASRMARAGKR